MRAHNDKIFSVPSKVGDSSWAQWYSINSPRGRTSLAAEFTGSWPTWMFLYYPWLLQSAEWEKRMFQELVMLKRWLSGKGRWEKMIFSPIFKHWKQVGGHSRDPKCFRNNKGYNISWNFKTQITRLSLFLRTLVLLYEKNKHGNRVKHTLSLIKSPLMKTVSVRCQVLLR